MSTLLAGLLGAALASNAPAALSNVVVAETGINFLAVNTNDPVEVAYHKVLEDDDAAEQEVLRWTDEARASTVKGPENPGVTLHNRIRQRLLSVKQEYEHFIALHPNHARIRLAYGSFLNDTQDEEGAVEQWEKSKDLDPSNPAAWNDLANYYGHRSPVKKAFEYYEKAIALNNREPVYYENMATTVYLFRTDAEEYYHLTETQVFDKALDLYRKAIALDPDNFVLYSDYAQSFYGTKPPRFQDGLVAWQGALKIAHDDREREGVYIHFARLHWKLGQYDQAKDDLAHVTSTEYAVMKKRIAKNIDDSINHKISDAPTD